ncbi:MAG: hypothetical protein LAT61_08440 [Alcanivorax sp.]|nr:hypothetical protein [Alcanivorax sp.]
MQTLLLSIFTLVTLGAVIFAHRALPARVATAQQVLLVRAVLVSVGVLFGAIMTWRYGQLGDLSPWLVFFSAFGVTHVPAAVILWLKGLEA